MRRRLLWIVPVAVGVAALAGGMWLAGVRPPVAAGTLAVAVSPAGAAVYVDDVFRGIAPDGGALAVGGLARGRHVVRADAVGRLSRREVVELADRDREVRFDLPPEPTGKLIVESDPPGARVLIDGISAGQTALSVDLPPGRHVVNLALPNHNAETRVVELPAQDAPFADERLTPLPIVNPEEPDGTAPRTEETVASLRLEELQRLRDGEDSGALRLFVPLRSRTLEMFQRRLAENPLDIAAYSDYWVLLFDRGRIDEAARVAVAGMLLGQSGAALDESAREGFEKLRNEIRNKEGRRGTPRWQAWTLALDREIIAAVAAGKVTPRILEEFKQHVSSQELPDDYFAAYGALCRRPEYRGEIPNFVALAVERGQAGNLLPYFAEWLENPPDSLAECANQLRGLERVREQVKDGAEREQAARLMDRVRGYARPLRVPGRDGNWLWTEALVARAEGRAADWRTLAEGAIEASTTTPARANLRRLELAQELADDPSPGQRAKAARLATYIINQNLANDEAVDTARRLRDRLAREGVPAPTGWPAELPAADWLVAGPFPIDGAAIGPRTDPERPARALAALFPPEIQPFVRDQRFAGRGGEAGWRRVELSPAEPEAADLLLFPDPARRGGASPGEVAAGYARTWIYSRTARTVELSINSPGVFKLYGPEMAELVVQATPPAAPDPAADTVNGEETAKPPTHTVSLKLARGYTPLMVKWLTPAAGPAVPFELRVRAFKGQVLDTVRVSAARL